VTLDSCNTHTLSSEEYERGLKNEGKKRMMMCAAISKVSAKGAECGRSFSTEALFIGGGSWLYLGSSVQVSATGVRRPYTRYHRN
jgi:hypothetical protein